MASKKVGFAAGKSPNGKRAAAEKAAKGRIKSAVGGLKKGVAATPKQLKSLARAARLPPSSAGSGG